MSSFCDPGPDALQWRRDQPRRDAQHPGWRREGHARRHDDAVKLQHRVLGTLRRQRAHGHLHERRVGAPANADPGRAPRPQLDGSDVGEGRHDPRRRQHSRGGQRAQRLERSLHCPHDAQRCLISLARERLDAGHVRALQRRLRARHQRQHHRCDGDHHDGHDLTDCHR